MTLLLGGADAEEAWGESLPPDPWSADALVWGVLACLTRARHRYVFYWGAVKENETSPLAAVLHGQPEEDGGEPSRLIRARARVKGRLGVTGLNKAIEELLLKDEEVRSFSPRSGNYHGQPIIVHRNDYTVVVLPTQQSPILTRELIYTGVTRAARQMTMIGDKDLLVKALKKEIKA